MQGSPSSQSAVAALQTFRAGLASLLSDSGDKSHMNDCHDERGQFCEGGGSSPSGGKSGKTKPRNGISPQASISSAERKGKEYGYAKKVSFYQCTSVDQANEINAQMAELSDDTGIVMERVYVYKERGSKKGQGAIGYHSGWAAEIGIRNEATAEWHARTQAIDQSKIDVNIQKYTQYAREAAEKGDTDGQELWSRFAQEAESERGYAGHTYAGNGVRNPTVDHEFGHAVVNRWCGFNRPEGADDVRVNDVKILGRTCHDFAKRERFSMYAVEGRNPRLEHGEAIAEVYSYWKSGKTVPESIHHGFKAMEAFR